MQTRRNLTNINPKNTKKSPIHENTKITCDFGDDRCRIASARLEKDIFVKTHLHTSPIVVKIINQDLQILKFVILMTYNWICERWLFNFLEMPYFIYSWREFVVSRQTGLSSRLL